MGDTIEVNHTSELERDVIYCREVVTCAERGCIRENTYYVRLYTSEKVSEILGSIGFSEISFKKDFMDRQGQGDYGTMTNRMVAKARKKK